MTSDAVHLPIDHLGIDGRALSLAPSPISRSVASLVQVIARGEQARRCTLFTDWPAPSDASAVVRHIPAVSDEHFLAVARVQRPDLLLMTMTGIGRPLVAYRPLAEAAASVLSLPDFTRFSSLDEAMSTSGKAGDAARRVASWASRLVVYSDAAKSDVVERLAVAADRVDVVPPGVGTQFFPSADLPTVLARSWTVRTRLGLPASFVLCIASGTDQGNDVELNAVVGALARARARGSPGMHVAVIGTTGQNARQTALRAYARGIGLAQSLSFLDDLREDDVPDLYLAAEAIAVTPSAEGKPFLLAEAMASGLPAIVARDPWLDVRAGEASLPISSWTAELVGEALIRVLTDRTERQRLVDSGRQRAPTLTADRMVQSLLKSFAIALRSNERPRARDVQSSPDRLASVALTPSDRVTVSVVIPTYDRARHTRACLDALDQTLGRRADVEVIVVDNGSTDETRADLAERERVADDRDRPRFRVIANDENRGFARAANQGARAARGSKILFLNNDTIPQNGWLDAVLACVASDPTIGIVGAKLLYPDGTIQHAGVAIDERRRLTYVYHRLPGDLPAANETREYQCVTGAAMLVDRALFETLGGFDEAYRNGYEDLDLCCRVRQSGYRVVYCPGATLVHFESTTTGRFDHDEHNRQLFFQRWSHLLVVDNHHWRRRGDPRWRVRESRDRRELSLGPNESIESPGGAPWSERDRVLARAEDHSDLMRYLPTPDPSTDTSIKRLASSFVLKVRRKALAGWLSYLLFWEQARFNRTSLALIDTLIARVEELEREVAELRRAP